MHVQLFNPRAQRPVVDYVELFGMSPTCQTTVAVSSMNTAITLIY